MRLRFGIRQLPIAILTTLALVSAAPAETLTYGADTGIAETDNVTLASTDRISQTIAMADLDFDVKQQTRLLDVDAKGNFSYLDYLQNAFGSQLIGRFDGLGRFALIPERLTWVVQDAFGQAALDPLAPTTPNNLENVNYFSTGPDVAFRFGATSFVNMSARVARAQYQTSPLNSNRLLGNLAWGLQLSSNSSVSLNGDTERVLFENTVVNSDFDRTNAFVHYELKGARTSFSADLGATTIDQGGVSTTGGLAKIQLTRTVSQSANLTFTAGRDLTDGTASFSGLQAGAIGVVGTAPAAVTSASYTSDYVSAGWQYQRNRTTIAVSGRWEKDVYGQASEFDYSRGGAEFSVERKLTHALTAQIMGRLYKTDYPHGVFTTENGGIVTTINGVTVVTENGTAVANENVSSDFEDGLIGAALIWRHGRALEIRLRCEHSSRVATGLDAGYRENRVYLTIGYRPRPDPDNDPGAYAPG